MDRHEELARQYTEIQNDLRNFYNKNNGAAGTRARLGLVALGKLCKVIRTEISIEKERRKAAKATA